MAEITTIKASQVIKDFIASIDDWDKENVMYRYDMAIMEDAVSVIARIERSRDYRNNRSQ